MQVFRRRALELLEVVATESGREYLVHSQGLVELVEFLAKDDAEVCKTSLKCIQLMCELSVARLTLVNLHVVPAVLRLLEQQLDLETQRCILSIIRSLSLMDYGRDALVECNAVGLLVQRILSNDTEIRCAALRATFNLSVVNVHVRQRIVDAGALPYLLSATTIESEGQCAAVGTLANLATESEIKRDIVKDFNGLKPLLSLLTTDDVSILTHACRALFAIAANDDNKLAIAQAGGLPLLLNCMNSFSDSVRMNAAGALANLAIHPVNKLKLVQSGALPYLHAMAHSPNNKIQRQVARCLFALAAHVENRHAIIQADCLSALVYLLQSSNGDVQLNAAGAIGNIAMTDEYKLQVVSSGALARIVELARVMDIRVQRQAARAIFTLTAKDTAKTVLNQVDGLSTLVALMNIPNEDIQRDAAGALANMAIGTENKDKIVEIGGLEPLVSLLKSNSIPVQRQAARAVFALAGSPLNQEKIVEIGGLGPLVNLLSSKNDEVQKHATGAIANLANRYPNRLVQGGLLKKIVNLVLEHPNLDVRRQAARAVFNIIPHGKQRAQIVLSPYAGLQGEQQRIRHDMRSLFELTLKIQEAPTCRNFSLPPSSCTRQTTKAVSNLNEEWERKPGTLQARGRKRSCDDLLANFDPFGSSSARTFRKKKQNGFEHDVRLVLPVSDNCSSPGVSDMLNGTDMEEERKQQVHEVQYVDFIGHIPILFARCSLFASLIEMSITSNEKTEANELKVQVPVQFAVSETAWLVFLEYLYTDSVRIHASYIRASTSLATQVSELAFNCGLKRLCCFCLELNPSTRGTNSFFKDFNMDQYRASTWVKDMSRLFDESSVEFSDVDLTLDPEFLDIVPNPSPRHRNFELPGSPRPPSYYSATDTSPKRFKSALTPRAAMSNPEVVPLGVSNTNIPKPTSKKPARISTPTLSAHKVMLASRCSYFKAQFGGCDWSDSVSDSVRFSGTEEALRIIVRYLYCGIDEGLINILNNDPSLALQVLVIANEYNLDGLQLQCESYLIKWINEKTVFVLLQELELVHAPLLRTLCVHFVITNNLLPTSAPSPSSRRKINSDSCVLGPDVIHELASTAKKWELTP